MENRQIKERPILFSSEMVRAVLDGRKTQTRRVVKPQPIWKYPGNYERHHTMSFIRGVWCATVGFGLAQEGYRFFNCPYGEPSDRLWVRESFNWSADADLAPNENHMKCNERELNRSQNVVWKADGQEFNPNHPEWGKTIWKPSIHMPRWASRILLEIVNIRVERVQDISLTDINAEGTPYTLDPTKRPYGTRHEQFQRLWDSINGKKYPWEANPWVWVIEFKKVEV